MTDLGTLTGSLFTSWGLSINDSGVVVGYSDYQSTYHAFVYSGGKMKDLNKQIAPGSGWVLIRPSASTTPARLSAQAQSTAQSTDFC